MLLRVAIGWHFYYEGHEKLESWFKGSKPFTAEPYLRGSTGPLAPYFRGIVPDVNGLAKLDPVRLKSVWSADIERIGNHYSFDDAQRAQAAEVLKKAESDADVLFADREFTEKRTKYKDELRAVQAVERKKGALSYERERAVARRKELDTDRKDLVAKVDAIGGALHDAVVKLASAPQRLDTLEKLDPARLKAAWAGDVERTAKHYGFEDAQRTQAAEVLKKAEAEADALFADRDFSEARNKHSAALLEVQADEKKEGATAEERERAAAKAEAIRADAKPLTAKLDAIGGTLRNVVAALATSPQKATADQVGPLRTSLDWVNILTVVGLLVMGFCLITGLFTPLAALAGAVFLGQIYLSMPPWPGLPANPMAEGHYLIVNKNLVEMLALLALVFIPTGQWIGLDAFVFGRTVACPIEEPARSRASNSTAASASAPPAGSNPRPALAPDVAPIPLSHPGVSKRD